MEREKEIEKKKDRERIRLRMREKGTEKGGKYENYICLFCKSLLVPDKKSNTKLLFHQYKYHDRISIALWNYVIQQMSFMPSFPSMELK